jgi:O-antigen ligase
MFLGLLQFSGAEVRIPLINNVVGDVSGNFANRNHFALFMAIGCIVAPAWACTVRRQVRWRMPTALGLVTLFMLTILGSGSRAALLVGVIAVIVGAILIRDDVRRLLRSYPRWVAPAAGAVLSAIVAILGLSAVIAGRAVSIRRLLSGDVGQDMRGKGLPSVLDMIREYFPVGSGFGGFDPVFRIHEPLELLNATYFNHAHNDVLEIVMDGGLAGLLLLLAALVWWCWASIRSWLDQPRQIMARAGSTIILLVLVASIFDYPARTPLIMAVLVISAVWLVRRDTGAVALPTSQQPL